jgi:hypothetical protein
MEVTAVSLTATLVLPGLKLEAHSVEKKKQVVVENPAVILGSST